MWISAPWVGSACHTFQCLTHGCLSFLYLFLCPSSKCGHVWQAHLPGEDRQELCSLTCSCWIAGLYLSLPPTLRTHKKTGSPDHYSSRSDHLWCTGQLSLDFQIKHSMWKIAIWKKETHLPALLRPLFCLSDSSFVKKSSKLFFCLSVCLWVLYFGSNPETAAGCRWLLNSDTFFIRTSKFTIISMMSAENSGLTQSNKQNII